jgi:hypothetical protein
MGIQGSRAKGTTAKKTQNKYHSLYATTNQSKLTDSIDPTG